MRESKLTDAVGYSPNQKQQLTVFLGNGEVSIISTVKRTSSYLHWIDIARPNQREI